MHCSKLADLILHRSPLSTRTHQRAARATTMEAMAAMMPTRPSDGDADEEVSDPPSPPRARARPSPSFLL